MASSFASLKKSRQSSLEKLQTEIDKINNPQNNFSREDDRFWKAELDKSGNGYAVIRFLPPSNGEDMPYQRVFNHGFQGPGGWYIENSLTTIGQKDPLAEYNSTLWNSGIEANKEIARKQKRRLTYFSNIFVVEDKANPQNEGKVHLFRYGKKIFDKISSLSNPEFEDETPTDVFNFWEGANFKLKIRKVEGFTNYDKAEFAKPTPLSENDEDMERIWKQQYSLQDFLKPDNFKSYEELNSRLSRVLGKGVDPSMQRAEDTVIGPVNHTDVPFDGGVPNRPAAQTKPHSVQGDNLDQGSYDDGEGDTLSYFAKLAEEE